MDAARLQAVLNKGYGIAASRIAHDFTLYRPASATSVIAPDNIVATVKASMAAFGANFSFDRPDSHKEHYNNILFDPTQARIGDYLVNASLGTWFIGNLEPIKPPLGIRCDQVVNVLRAGSADACGTPGLVGYGGITAANEVTLLQGWPAALSEVGARGGQGTLNLPLSAGASVVEVMMPAFPGVIIYATDIVTDNLGRRFTIKGAELSVFGWKIMAMEAVA